jgi:hypothetical protein
VRARTLLALAACAAAVSLGPAPARATKICYAEIPVGMLDKVFSGSARPGNVFRFRVEHPETLDDGMMIPEGTLGYGVVRYAEPAGPHAHDGVLALEPRYLIVPKPFGGVTRVEVTMNPTLPVTYTPAGMLSQGMSAAQSVPVAGLAVTAVNVVRWGRNLTLGPGFSFSVLPVDNLARGPVC